SLGKLLTVTDPKNQTRRFEYDFAGRTILDNAVDAMYQYSYNEDEKLSLVTDGTNEYSFVYNDKYDIPIQETFPDGTILNRTLDNNGNITKVTLRKDSNILYEVDYTYNNAEKLESITALGKTIEYERDNNGEITKIKLDNVAAIEYEYDALKTVVSMSYKHDNTELKKLSYTYDSLRNITSIYTRINNVAFSNWQYEYDEHQNTLKSAKLYKGAEQAEYFDSYSQESFEYDFAGNHYNVTKNSPSNNATNITINKNNQIFQIARPSDLIHPIRGSTNTNAELKIFIDNAQQSYTKPLGTSNFLFTLPANLTIPKSHKIKFESTLANEGANGVSAKTMTLGSVYTHPRNETLIYDMNGNLIEDSRWKYVWDGRNRLISVKTSDTALASGITNEAYVFTYDYKDRKISSKKYIEDDSTGQMVLYSTNLRYYDNWNLIYETIEYTNTSITSEIKKYYYGLDLNNSLHGSSGTGGLRLLEINGVAAFVFNNTKGNIEGLYSPDINASDNLNSSNQLTLALYDYTPFGTIFRQKGPLANKNPLRFSTRYDEGNTKLYYYGYRHYSPDTFKWLSKDPMEEFGGINLYQFCGNDPINYWDRLGLCWWKFSMPDWEFGEFEWPPKIKPQGGYFNSELTFHGDGFNISGMAGINQDETGQFSGSIATSYGDTKFTATAKWNTNSEWGASASVDIGLPGGLGDFKVQGGYDSPKGWNASSSYEFDIGGGWKGSIGGTYNESRGWGLEFKIFWK
ncbi:MAG: hypothetical protein IKO42_02825, partial [Opitutales bacterium]|nr:hypothetical protein [Opitutales bacterium]